MSEKQSLNWKCSYVPLHLTNKLIQNLINYVIRDRFKHVVIYLGGRVKESCMIAVSH